MELIDYTGPVGTDYVSPFAPDGYAYSIVTYRRYYVHAVDVSGVRALVFDVETGEERIADNYWFDWCPSVTAMFA